MKKTALLVLVLLISLPILYGTDSTTSTTCATRDMIRAIAVEEGVPPNFAIAIALTENWTLNPNAVSPPNRNGTRDFGLMQLNENYFCSIKAMCKYWNTRTAVRHIRWLMDVAHGNTFWAVAAMYNAGTAWFRGQRPLPYAAARYADRVMLRWRELEPGINRPVVVLE